MRADFAFLSAIMTLAGCGVGTQPCENLRIGMSRAQMVAQLGPAGHIKVYDAKRRPSDLYMDVRVYTYTNKMPFSEPDVVYVDNHGDKLIRISCQDKPIRLHVDGSTVPENYLDAWRIDKTPPASKKDKRN